MSKDLDYYVDMIIEELKELVADGAPENDLYDARHEMLDGLIPVYYSGQLELLENNFNEIFFEDVSEYVGDEITLSSVLPIAIYKAMERRLEERWDEVQGDDGDE